MGIMNIYRRAWRKQVVVQHEKNGNDAALRVRKQRITLLKNAKSRRIFSKPISACAQQLWPGGLRSSSKSYCLVRKNLWHQNKSHFYFILLILTLLINAAALDLYSTQSSVCCLVIRSLCMCVCCVCWRMHKFAPPFEI